MFNLDGRLFSNVLVLSVAFSIEINAACASPSIHLNARQASLPSGWSSLGCYTDSTTLRALRTASYSSSGNMTIESCLAFCTPAGYKYAGVENGRECYCDNTIHSPAAPANAADCNMPCTGNSAEFCGAGDRINMFSQDAPTVSLPAGWNSLGCYTDLSWSRTLRTASYKSVNSMSIESCIDFCSSSEYQYAGVEYGSECYCDNVIHSPGAPVNGLGCNMHCTGNAAEFCGAGDRLNIFSWNSTTVVTTPTPTIVRQLGTWDYKGCYVDIGPRILSKLLNVAGGATVESCTAACKSAGYGLAGLEYGKECWCDNYLPYGKPAPDDECNMPCDASASELCGAGNRLAVYQDSSATPISPDTCIPGRGPWDFQNFQLQAVPVNSAGGALAGGVIQQIYANILNFYTRQNMIQYTILRTCPNCGSSVTTSHNFSMVDGVVSPFGLAGGPEPIAPVVGGPQVFVGNPAPFTPYAGFCAKPNPVSPDGPFIGFPALSVSGHADNWALCTNTSGRVDIVYSPIATSPHYLLSSCQKVVLQMSQWYTYIGEMY